MHAPIEPSRVSTGPFARLKTHASHSVTGARLRFTPLPRLRSATDEFLGSHPPPGGFAYLLFEIRTLVCRDARGEVVNSIVLRAQCWERTPPVTHPRRPTREGGPPASAGVRLITRARET